MTVTTYFRIAQNQFSLIEFLTIYTVDMKKHNITTRKRVELILGQLKIILESLNNENAEYNNKCVDELSKHSGYPNFVDKALISSAIIEVFFDWYEEEKVKTLQDEHRLKELADLSKRIDERIEEMPLKYKISVPLPSGGKMVNFRFNKNISLKSIEETDVTKNLDSLEKLLNPSLKEQKTSNKVRRNYLIVEDRGYIAGFNRERLLNYDAFYLYKIFAAASIVMQSWEHLAIFSNLTLGGAPSAYTYKIEEVENPRKQKIKKHTVEDAALVQKFKFADETKQYVTNELYKLLLEKQKSPIIDDTCERLQKALFWFYELKKVQYNHLKIVYAVTSFDAFFLISDSENMKRAVIANELAESYDREAEIVEIIFKLYNRRNSIIHGSEAIVSTGSAQSKESLNDSKLAYDASQILEELIKKRLIKLLRTKKSELLKQLSS